MDYESWYIDAAHSSLPLANLHNKEGETQWNYMYYKGLEIQGKQQH